MKSIKPVITLSLVALAVGAALVARSNRSAAEPTPPKAVEGQVEAQAEAKAQPKLTFVELGSDRCTSCRAMIPVLQELKGAHACALDVRFVDVWDDPEEGKRFKVTTIPTQVLLAPDGSEITRHTGFWSADAIRAAFAKGGHPLEKEKEAGICGS